MPSRYVWTPRGCIDVDGYWDYDLADRGMCFAPVYFRTAAYARPGLRFWPRHVLDLAALRLHLFVHPRYHHYYFGDWYGYDGRFGIYTSFDFHRRFGYDPLWSYHVWHFGRQGIDYADRIRGWHRYFQSHEDLRPPHTVREQRMFVERHRDVQLLGQLALADDVNNVLSKRAGQVAKVSDDERQRVRQSAATIGEFAKKRAQFDAGARAKLGAERPRLSEGRPSDQRLALPETPGVKPPRQLLEGRTRRQPEQRTARRPELPGRDLPGAAPDERRGTSPGGPPAARDIPGRAEEPKPSPRPDVRESLPQAAPPAPPQAQPPRGRQFDRGSLDQAQPGAPGSGQRSLTPRSDVRPPSSPQNAQGRGGSRNR